MQKCRLDRRLEQMTQAEGTIFRAGAEVGIDLTAEELRSRSDAVRARLRRHRVARAPHARSRAHGVHRGDGVPDLGQPDAARRRKVSPISAEVRTYAIIGGGDTGTDCLGTVDRQRARVGRAPRHPATPTERRTVNMPWPTYPAIHRTSPAHEEGGTRLFSMDTLEFLGDETAGCRRSR